MDVHDPPPGQGGSEMTGKPTLNPKAEADTPQARRRSPFACARRRRAKSIRFKKLCEASLVWETAKGNGDDEK
jgi:hypothetical protein